MKIYFATGNDEKFVQAKEFLGETVDLLPEKNYLDNDCSYIDVEDKVKFKLLRVFDKIKRPVLVDDTTISIWINGDWTFLDWNLMNKVMLLRLISNEEDGLKAKVITQLSYCDGRKTEKYTGEVIGKIKIDEDTEFNPKSWDNVFYPEGESKNIKELGYNSRFNTARKIAFKEFKRSLTKSTARRYDLDNKNIYNEIKNLIKKDKLILFIGSGVSKNVGLPSWNDLICEIGTKISYDEDVFKLLGSNLELAEFYSLEKNNAIGDFRNSIASRWQLNTEKFRESNIYKLICLLNVSTIYTTNYDSCIEDAFKAFGKEYVKVVNVNDLKKIDEKKTTIIKLHGDFTSDESIVLTESSYFERLGNDSPLDLKLWVDSLEKHILFIGYSMSDINLRYFFYKFNKLGVNANNNQLKHYIFMTKEQEINMRILKERGIETIVEEVGNEQKSLEKFLSSVVDISSSYERALEKNDLATMRLIQKSDLHNHAPYGGNIVDSKGILDEELIKNLNGIEEFNMWTDAKINKRKDFSSEEKKQMFLRRVENAIIQAKRDSINPLVLNFGYCAKKYFDNDYYKLINEIKKLKDKHKVDFFSEICLDRKMTKEQIDEETDKIIETNFFSSVDLIGDENIDVDKFEDAYKKFKDNQFVLKAHIGETSGPEMIEKCIKTLNLDVINHGINIVKDIRVMDLAYDNNIVFNVCVTSNVRLSYVPTYCKHPIRQMYDYGLNITICSDDILVFDSEVSNEYLNLYKHGVFNAEELNKIRLNGIKRGEKYVRREG